jgi:hypothetical protein
MIFRPRGLFGDAELSPGRLVAFVRQTGKGAEQ